MLCKKKARAVVWFPCVMGVDSIHISQVELQVDFKSCSDRWMFFPESRFQKLSDKWIVFNVYLFITKVNRSHCHMKIFDNDTCYGYGHLNDQRY